MNKPEHPTFCSLSKLRALPRHALPDFCQELRQFLIDSISSSGGHFAAGLGALELTVALHYVFNTPDDILVWDVGHQSYPHKILTGRADRIQSIRTQGGLAPFPARDESKYDSFGVGHSSTSISAAIGMAVGAKAREGDEGKRNVVAIIGDGGMTAGMAYEAMNHLGALKANVLIVLNDNEMSISPNVGAMTNYLTRILSSGTYHAVLEGGKRLLKPMPPLGTFAKRTQEHLKGMIVPGTLFEELGIDYYGPIDGHNIDVLVKTLRNMKSLSGPRLLHTVTRKGKGYPFAEKDPVKYHAVGEFDPGKGMHAGTPTNKPPAYSEVFGRWICDLAERDPRVVAITPAMREGSGLIEFEQRFPDRYYDVGIAEQHAVTLAAGLACENLRPVVAIYSTFLQRAYDQLIHDVAIQNLPVLFAIDRAGLVGADGRTHAGMFDLSFLRCVPNMVIMTPGDENLTHRMLTAGFMYEGPAAVRYPRGTGPGAAIDNHSGASSSLSPLSIGCSEHLRDGQSVMLMVFGSPLTAARIVADRLNLGLTDMRFVKPLDTEAVMKATQDYAGIVTIEDNVCSGGGGSAVCELLAQNKTPVLNLGLPDRFQEHATREQQLSEAGLDATGIEARVRRFIKTLEEGQ